MLTLDELKQIQDEVDTNYIHEARYDLDLMLRQYIVDWTQGDKLRIAAYSAVNGHWDDVKKDIQRKRISKAEVIELLDEMLKCKLITVMFYEQFIIANQLKI
jgi:hypothetical protein